MNLLDDPNKAGILSLGLRLMSTPGKFGSALGQAGLGAMGDIQQAKQAQAMAKQKALQEQMLMMQLEQIKAQQAAAKGAQERQANDQGLMQRLMGMPVEGMMPQGQMGPGMPSANSGVDPRAFLNQGGSMAGLQDVIGLNQILSPPKKAPLITKPGDIARNPETGEQMWSNPEAPEKDDADVRLLKLVHGENTPAFFSALSELAKKKTTHAPAMNIGLPKIEVKMGESVAGQIGPMAKDSRIQAQGAVGMFDSAERIQKALDSGKASTGPFTTQVQTVKQLVQKVAGGSDEGIRQTRQVIKGLAQMSVEARKELQGQGQVTESEAAAVAKAESGDINDLTTGELQDLVKLTKRAAHFRAKNHQGILDSMAGSDATRGMVPYYKIQNMDALLNYKPELPQIGGGNAVEEALKQYGKN